MPKVSQEYLDERRKHILHAAFVCFSRRGFHSATMQEICQEADLSAGAIYGYFDSKEELIKAIAEENLVNSLALIEGIKSANHDAKTSLEELSQVFFSMIDDLDNNAERISIELWAEAYRNEEIRLVVRKTINRIHEMMAEFLKQGQEAGEINKDIDPSNMARIMISLFDGLLIQKVMDDTVDVWSYVETMKDVTKSIYVQ